MTITQPTFVARINNVHVKATCAICGRVDRESNVDLYIAGSYDWVCLSCVALTDPELADAYDWYWREVMFAVDRHELFAFYEALALAFGTDDWPDPISTHALRDAAAAIAGLRGTAA